MENPIKILIVEDEMIIAANLSLLLSELGYEVNAIVSRGEEALLHIKQNQPNIILLDINLKGQLDGIETAQLMQKEYNIPIIYLTAYTDDAHFNRAKKTNPSAFISKPFKKLDLQHAIELTINRIKSQDYSKNENECNSPYILSDSLFVRNNDKRIKILIKDIYYIEAERNYCRIVSKDRECLLVMTLKDINDKLPNEHFLRIHRSYIVNISHIDEVAGSHIVISRKAIPMSKTLKRKLINRLQTI